MLIRQIKLFQIFVIQIKQNNEKFQHKEELEIFDNLYILS